MFNVYILTVNDIPIVGSISKESLEKRKKEMIQDTLNDNSLQILHHNEDEIAYHTGINYCTDKYNIEQLDMIK